MVVVLVFGSGVSPLRAFRGEPSVSGDQPADRVNFLPGTTTYYRVRHTCLFGVDMPAQLSSRLGRLLQRDSRGEAPPNASTAPAADSSLDDRS
jgi:hypothetical protein